MNPILLSVNQIAQTLGVSSATVYYWVHCKAIPFLKVGKHLRFDPEQVLEYFRQQTENSHAQQDPCHRLRAKIDQPSNLRSLKNEYKEKLPEPPKKRRSHGSDS